MKIFIWYEFKINLKPGKYTEDIHLSESLSSSLFKYKEKLVGWKCFKRWIKDKFTLKLEIQLDSSESINEMTKILDRISKEK